MTKTRKQIIELIEPYMDKTLSFGCYIIGYPNKGKEGPQNGIYGQRGEYFNNRDEDYDEIIGHYDITAVLKYIENKSYNIHNEQLDGTLYVYKSDGFDEPYLGQIIFKPLYLYTEQEEVHLLELLTKLKGR